MVSRRRLAIREFLNNMRFPLAGLVICCLWLLMGVGVLILGVALLGQEDVLLALCVIGMGFIAAIIGVLGACTNMRVLHERASGRE